MHTRIRFASTLCLASSFALCSTAAAQPSLDLALRTRAGLAVEKALSYLVSGQSADGAWKAFERSHPAVTALALKCLLQAESYGPKHTASQRGLEYLLQFVQPDGGIYVPDEGMRNYHTSVALMALASAKDPKLAKTIAGAQDFLKKLQWDGGEGHEASSSWYGGQGYGRHKRPDLSNTQLMLEALHQSGLPSDDPVYQKALVFISRCQMLDSTNDRDFAQGATDGGFVYTPVGRGESKAGTQVVDGQPLLRSYGSMTYAGFKSLLYAKVDRDDLRIKEALNWIRRHYTLTSNPNMPDGKSREGLFYYYHVFAKAAQAWGEEVITDTQGVAHPWRTELCRQVLSLQRTDGSWVNEADRWYEGNPHLVTAYAVLALQSALDTAP